MSPTIPSEYVEGLDRFLADAAKVVFVRSYADLDAFELALDLWEPSEAVSIWLGCHTTEGLRKDFDEKVNQVHKILLRIVKTQWWLNRLSAELRTSPKAEKILDKWVSGLMVYGAELHSFWVVLKRCYNISDAPKSPKPDPPVGGDSLDNYRTLYEYARKQWNTFSQNFKLVESLSNGPGVYNDCVNKLLPGFSQSEKTRRFHQVLGPLNETIGEALGLNIYRPRRSQQVLVCKVGENPNATSSQAGGKRSAKKSPKKGKRR